MVSLLSTWQFNVICYLVFVILFFQFYKLAVSHVKVDGAATIILQIIAGLSALLFFPLFETNFPTSPTTYLVLLAACIFYAISDRMNTTARKHLEVSAFSIISELSAVFLIIFGLFFLKESFVWTKMLGAALVIVSNVLLIYERGTFKPNKYSLIAILSQLAFSVAASIDIGISRLFNLPLYIFITLVLPALMIFVVGRYKPSQISAEWRNGNKLFFLITGVSWSLVIIFMLRAFRFGQVTTVVPVSALSVLLNVLIATVFLRERSNIVKKVVLALLVVGGVSLTAFS